MQPHNEQTEASKTRDHRAASIHMLYLYVVYIYSLNVITPLREEWRLARTNVKRIIGSTVFKVLHDRSNVVSKTGGTLNRGVFCLVRCG